MWSDLVSPFDLVVAIGISSVFTGGFCAIGWWLHGSQFFWGLAGATLGFVLSALLMKPKRNVVLVTAEQAEGHYSEDPDESGSAQAEVRN